MESEKESAIVNRSTNIITMKYCLISLKSPEKPWDVESLWSFYCHADHKPNSKNSKTKIYSNKTWCHIKHKMN
jgi:hypothetical protein